MLSKRALASIDRSQITDDTPLRLDIAAALKFPDGSIGASSLRKEAARGRLVIWRVAGKDFTSLRELNEMLERCRVQRAPPVSGFDRTKMTVARPSASSKVDGTSAMVALRARIEEMTKEAKAARVESRRAKAKGR